MSNMAEVTQNNNKAQTKAFLLQKMIEKSKSKRQMQIPSNYLVARRKQLLNVCLLSLILVMSHADIAMTQKYNKSCC